MKIQTLKWTCHSCILFIFLLSLPVIIASGRRTGDAIEYSIPSVSLTLLSEKPLTIGDPVDLALTVYHDRKDTVIYPSGGEEFAPFMLRDHSMKRKKVGSGAMKTMVLYTVTVFQTGETAFPPLTVMVGDEEYQTEELVISILSVLPADEAEPELMDIVPPYRARIRTTTIIIILLGIAAAFGAYRAARKYLIRPRQIPKTVVETDSHFDPFAYSITELESVRTEHAQDRADSKRVYTTISHTLKLFFGSIFSIEALEMTTSEMKRYLRRSNARRTRYVESNQLINILYRSDMVKFAKDMPTHKKVEEDIDQSIVLIKEAQQKVTVVHRPGNEGDGDGV
jgi:hypothetical protein